MMMRVMFIGVFWEICFFDYLFFSFGAILAYFEFEEMGAAGHAVGHRRGMIFRTRVSWVDSSMIHVFVR